ncbi:MAG: hypothetical protein ACLQJR_28895 [Stellaceae bacterium]
MGKHCEPSLDELFGDRAVRQLMASDGVSEAALRALLGKVRQTRREHPGAWTGGAVACCSAAP